MNNERYEFIDSKTQAWDHGKLQDIITFIEHIDEYEISVKDIKEYIEDYRLRKIAEAEEYEKSQPQITEEQQRKIAELYRKCPECGAVLRLFSVEENENDYKSVWRCSSCIGCKKQDRDDETDPNERCTYERFSYKAPELYIQEHNDKVAKILGE